MRQFAKPTSLERLSLEARIVYTGFAVFMLLGYFTSAWLYADDDLGFGSEGPRRYYLGESDSTANHPSVSASGPTVELPDDEELSAGLRLAKPPRQVMETFHFHLLTVPVC